MRLDEFGYISSSAV